jgi:hypothetical protein
MNLLSREDLEALVARRQPPCVSAFLPAHRAGAEIQQDRIRLKNLLKEAEERLLARNVRGAEARRVLEPVHKLLPDDLFWRHQLDGLAVFCSPDFFRYYRLPVRLDELVVVADGFHVKPLLPILAGDGRFFVLALSQHDVRLFQASRHDIRDMRVDNIPKSVAAAVSLDLPEKPRQFHAVAAGQRRGEGAGIGHGRGVLDDDTKEHIHRFFQQVDRGLTPVFREQRGPVVLAAVDYLMPIYREVNTCADLIEGGIDGNPEDARPEDLHRRAWALVEPRFRQAQQRALERFEGWLGTPRASRQIREVLPAATEGRVEELFVPIGVNIWGAFAKDSGTVTVHASPQPGDEDLLDLAAVETIVRRGAVYAVPSGEMPIGAPVAAVFRY